ncbi:MAG TPA: hypothetical protein DDZ41_08540 [Flavobacterium sp.]|nr:hypothetical protein [Flavobacterium sp.]
MKKIFLFSFHWVAFTVFSQSEMIIISQDSSYIEATEYIGKDHLKNDYFINANVFKKKSSDKLFQYQNLKLGDIKNVCITSPLQLLLFYEDFNTVVLLDNQLNETQLIDGNLFETPVKIEAFGLSGQNNLWLYDGFLQKISLYNTKTRTNKIISTPLSSFIKAYHTDFNNFYWIDETNTLYSISIFGKITKKGTVPLFDAVQIINASALLIKRNGNLFYFDIKRQSETKIDLAGKSFADFFYTNKILSIFTQNQVINYKINIP